MCIVPKSLTKKWLSDCAMVTYERRFYVHIYILTSKYTVCVWVYRKCEELGGFSDGEKPFP